MEQPKKNLEDILSSARNQKPKIEFDEVMHDLNASLPQKTIVTKSPAFKMRWLLFSAAAVIIFSALYFWFHQPEQTASPLQPSVMETENPEPLPGEEKTPEPVAALPIENEPETELKSLEEITINDEGKNYVLYFKNDKMKEIRLNKNKIASGEWKNYKTIIQKAHAARKSYAEFAGTENDIEKSFEDYMMEQLRSRGLLTDSVQSIKFSKDYVMLDSVKLDNALFREILEAYKSKKK